MSKGLVTLACCVFLAAAVPSSVSAQNWDRARRAKALLQAAQVHEDAGRFADAEESFIEAIDAAKTVGSHDYSLLDKAYKSLAHFHYRRNQNDAAGRVYRQRVEALREPEHPGWELGIALFDLQGYYGAAEDLGQAVQTAQQAGDFYTGEDCTWSLAPETCDRRLADVQGLMGALYFNAKQNRLAESWLAEVLARPDDGVRPVIMLTSLQAYRAIKLAAVDYFAAGATWLRLLRFEWKYPEAREEQRSFSQ